jgi:hypothetical protein
MRFWAERALACLSLVFFFVISVIFRNEWITLRSLNLSKGSDALKRAAAERTAAEQVSGGTAWRARRASR